MQDDLGHEQQNSLEWGSKENLLPLAPCLLTRDCEAKRVRRDSLGGLEPYHFVDQRVCFESRLRVDPDVVVPVG